MAIIYETDEIAVRQLEESDAGLLVNWLSNPDVLQYYEGRDRPHDMGMVKESFYAVEDDDEQRCIVEYDSKPIGYIQFYHLDEHSRVEYGYYSSDEVIVGMDQFIGEIEYWNRGIGQKLVTSMVNYLIKHERTDKVVMDPQAWNARALACYAKCGFRKVKLMKEHEQHEGKYRDCWLIEYSA